MAGLDKREQAIIEFFSLRGIEAEKIDEESDSKTPDFLIKYGGMRILVELKTKLDDISLEERRESTLSKGEIFERVDVLAHDNSVSKVAKKATKQLAAKKKEFKTDMCFIFIVAVGESPGTQMETIEVTLYGKREIFTMGGDIPDKERVKECFYYSNSEFFNRRAVLDGVFLADAHLRGRLCINSVSDNYDAVISSEFVKVFDSGVLDPNRQEVKGRAFIVDGNVDRRNADAVDSYLCEKYEREKITSFNWPHISMTSSISLEDFEEMEKIP